MKNFKYFVLLIFFSSCSKYNLYSNNIENKIINLRSFIKKPTNIKHKNKEYLKEIKNIKAIKNLSGFSLALLDDLEKKRFNQAFSQLNSVIYLSALNAFSEENNLNKKYEWFFENDYGLEDYGFFLIKKIFKNDYDELCKKFDYKIFSHKSKTFHGNACINNQDIWIVSYE